jgi:iron complex transport system ATP-binding protein
MTPALQTRDLAVGYRKQPPVLSNINIQIAPGEVVALLGANGIGKSTLMRTLARMQPSLSGSVEINGTDIQRLSQYELARHVAVVLTERVAVGAMPAYQMVELGRYPHVNWSGLLSDKDRDIVRNSIAAVGAQHLAHRDLNELSDGERQRIMIARALAQQPSVLLLDEPAAFLDVSARVETVAMLRQLARAEGVAVLLSSHDLELSLRTADTIWLLDSHLRMHVGAPEDLLADGSIGAAFSGPGVTFSSRERSFKILRSPHGTATITGDTADLARTVLEREGFEITSAAKAILTVKTQNGAWQARGPNGSDQGTTFAELARFARRQVPAASPTPDIQP